jgi:hypothetical protein
LGIASPGIYGRISKTSRTSYKWLRHLTPIKKYTNSALCIYIYLETAK